MRAAGSTPQPGQSLRPGLCHRGTRGGDPPERSLPSALRRVKAGTVAQLWPEPLTLSRAAPGRGSAASCTITTVPSGRHFRARRDTLVARRGFKQQPKSKGSKSFPEDDSTLPRRCWHLVTLSEKRKAGWAIRIRRTSLAPRNNHSLACLCTSFQAFSLPGLSHTNGFIELGSCCSQLHILMSISRSQWIEEKQTDTLQGRSWEAETIPVLTKFKLRPRGPEKQKLERGTPGRGAVAVGLGERASGYVSGDGSPGGQAVAWLWGPRARGEVWNGRKSQQRCP